MRGSKKWWASKGVWAGVVTTAIGIYFDLQIRLTAGCGVEASGLPCMALPDVPPALISLLGALGLYGRVKASKVVS